MRKTQLLLQSQSQSPQQNDVQPNGNFNTGGNSGNSHNHGGGSESYSSTSSFSESYSDSSDLANWEEYVAENGTLFYAEYSLSARRPHEKRIEFTRSSSLRMGKKGSGAGGGAGASAREASRKQQQQQQQTLLKDKSTAQREEFKFSHIRRESHHNPQQQQPLQQQQQQQHKQLELVITAADRYRFGRRSTAVESILGFRVVPFSDQPECLMVDGFVHDMPAMQQQRQNQLPPIKRGDWFKSLDDIEVRTGNVDELLLQFVEPTKVCLKFQGPALDVDPAEAANGSGVANSEGGGPAGSGDLRRVENFAAFAELFEKLSLKPGSAEPSATTADAAHGGGELPFALLILPPECYQNDKHRDSLFYFPELGGANFLYKSRGSFLTLNAVLGAEMQTKPLVSKLHVDETLYYICYRALNSFLVLFGYAAMYTSLLEANLRSDELIGYMRFVLPSLCLEHLSSGNGSATSLRRFLRHFCTIQRTRILRKHVAREQQRRGGKQCLFEELLKESRSLPLPKEAQLRIFDALSEMEAMDYRNWNDEPLNTHREFFIHGSVLYYDHFLLAAQMPMEMRARVESFLRCRGIADFITDHCVKELYVWEEIVQPDNDGGPPEMGRYFLTICSRSHLMLAVVLKIFDAPDLAPDSVIPPSLFYIEEIQETLDHLISCGIESLAMFWSISNKRPEVLNPVESAGDEAASLNASAERDTNKLETFIKQKLTSAASAGGGNAGGGSGMATLSNQTQRSIAYDEEAAHLCSSLGGSSIHSLTQSEDDSSRKRLTGGNNDNASDSGSDWDNFGEQNPLHYGVDAEMQAQMTESLWKEINNVVPVKISAGWKNVVFHYVYVDSANGTVFCPLKATTAMDSNVGNAAANNNSSGSSCSAAGSGGGGLTNEMYSFLNEIRRACLIIHTVLQNTKNFRRQLAQEPTTSKSANAAAQHGNRITGLAIKEHGLTLQIREPLRTNANGNGDAESGNSSSAGSLFRGSFVVVGRLFHTPTREIYICHRPDVPQNMVEMAFRLSFFSAG